jgi:hypothetical protein
MIDELDYYGWRALALRPGQVELIAPLDVGPRVLELRRPGGKNLLFQFPEQLGGRGEAEYRFRGGHRLWHGPEHSVRTYQPDNDPVQVTRTRRGFTLSAAPEARTGLAKAIALEAINARTIKVTHRLTNRGLWAVECAPWALTMLRRGGFGVVPFLPKGEHPRDLLPTYSLVPWSYTDLSLPSWKWRRDFLGIDTRRATAAQKIGLTDYPGWSAYWLEGDTFVKRSPVRTGAVYPDLGCAFETYHDRNLIELETLGPLASLAPGRTATLVEWWTILPDLPRPDSQEVFAQTLAPAVAAWEHELA